ncbi:vWA domain-containing protein [Photobacterium kasasachensis]|uniref:vWA domain-containing protein n=1 Tax=Photobacterium kasasachensis TaxID=2910240 RepID=UPI003D0EB665
MLREPFYGHYLGGFHKSTVDSCAEHAPPLQLKPQGKSDLQLVCLSETWQKLDEDQRLGALKHEALHLVFGHLFARGRYADKARFDLAADLVVNQYLEARQLVDTAITLSDLNNWRRELKLPPLEPNRELAYYYQAIAQPAEELPPQWRSAISNSERSNDRGNDNNDKTSQTFNLGHDGWQVFTNAAKSERSLLEQQLENKLSQAAQRIELDAKSRGNLPAAVLHVLTQLLEKRQATVNWRRLLRLFANSSRRTSVKNTLRRPSKRYGTTPGTKIQPHQRLLVAVDTSASVDNKQLSAFFEEIGHIWRAGAEITVQECDTEIKQTYPYKGIAPDNVCGRGGTDFNAPIAYANQHKFDALIYFTDGGAPAPEIAPRMPLLWLLHSPEPGHTSNDLRRSGRVIPMSAS